MALPFGPSDVYPEGNAGSVCAFQIFFFVFVSVLVWQHQISQKFINDIQIHIIVHRPKYKQKSSANTSNEYQMLKSPSK